MSESFEELIAFQNALKEYVGTADTMYAKKHDEFFIGFEGRLVNILFGYSKCKYCFDFVHCPRKTTMSLWTPGLPDGVHSNRSILSDH